VTTIKDTPWTDAARERFRELYATGIAHETIAATLSEEFGRTFTKNACVRQAKTLKLPGRRHSRLVGDPKKRNRRKRPQDGRGPAPASEIPARASPPSSGVPEAGAVFLGVDLSSTPDVTVVGVKTETGELTVTKRRSLGIMELGLQHCRWPVDDPAGGPMRYCGARKREPIESNAYCPEHHRASISGATYVPRIGNLWGRRGR
jgi:hypothetical protein